MMEQIDLLIVCDSLVYIERGGFMSIENLFHMQFTYFQRDQIHSEGKKIRFYVRTAKFGLGRFVYGSFATLQNAA
jgi:hypothetical protein